MKIAAQEILINEDETKVPP